VASVGEGKKAESRVPKDRAAPVQYAMRTEFVADCHLLRAMLMPWVCDWAEAQAQLPLKDGTLEYVTDVDVVFSVVPKGPHLGEIRWLLNCIVDCHVAAESVARVDEYTGERVGHDELKRLMCRPPEDVITRARDSMKACYQDETRNLETVERLNAEMGDEAAYLKRLRAHYAKFWREHFAEPQDKDNLQMAAVAGAYFASAWRDGRPNLTKRDIEGILATTRRES
jgi:hypothetical protein